MFISMARLLTEILLLITLVGLFSWIAATATPRSEERAAPKVRDALVYRDTASLFGPESYGKRHEDARRPSEVAKPSLSVRGAAEKVQLDTRKTAAKKPPAAKRAAASPKKSSAPKKTAPKNVPTPKKAATLRRPYPTKKTTPKATIKKATAKKPVASK
ncbi:unnamed protein product [Clonostachys solani]|uniref:Uncharacterized protein n=1 Tax=Clonostachys solani TaxID=160281 RepID=A0A9N9ZII2_9HYPO|nr:unnamed protein product [Clonostachys solani]